jgi:predicted N-acyltransferase
MIEDRKIMVTIAWNPVGFHLVEILPKGRIVNAEYYPDNILTELIPLLPARGQRQCVIHAHNVTPALLKNAESFGQKMGSDSLHVHPIHRISHYWILSSSHMSRTACRELSFNDMTNYSLELFQ